MAGNGQNRWVVLLNRSPKGPLSEDEVRTLLTQGILRQNDIAYQVTGEGEDKGKSEWKLLWQFPEFNRRQTETPKVKQPVNPSISDRRQKTPPEEIKKKTLAELPPDLMEITPEDLLPRSTLISFKPEPENISPLDDEALLQEKPESPPPRFDWRWAYASSAVAILCLVVVKLPGLVRSWHRPSLSAPDEEHTRNEPIDALKPATSFESARSPADAVVPHPMRNMRRRPANPRMLRPPSAPSPEERTAEPEPPSEPESPLDSARDDEHRDEESTESKPPSEDSSTTDPAPRKKTFRRRAASTSEDETAPPAEGDSAGVRDPDSSGAPPEDAGGESNQ